MVSGITYLSRMPIIFTARPPRRIRRRKPAAALAMPHGSIVTARDPRRIKRRVPLRIGGPAAASAADRLWRELVRRATGSPVR